MQSRRLAFLLPMAAEEDKAQRKQSKHKRVFLRFRHKRSRPAENKYPKAAVERNAYGGVVRPTGAVKAIVKKVCPGGDGEVADGIGQSALASPRRGNVHIVTKRICPRQPNAKRIPLCAVLQENVVEGSSLRTEGDPWTVGGIDRQRIQGGGAVSGVRACWKELISGARLDNSVAAAVVVGDGRLGLRSENGASYLIRSGTAGEGPKRCIVGVALEGLDGEDQLRLALFNGNERQKRRRHPSR